ncbi:hypothetical protein LIER_41239 [Lithospermum erythrorhizon]|uniref:CCHC-type domain-containing protein n=1 Tax=Lithospermum erythrorhizon TaxID=34254 RepID=A0AAV3R872_LITER
MFQGTFVNTNLNNMNKIINQLATIGFFVDDEWKDLIILASLPISFKTIRASVSHSAGKDPLNSKDVVSRILDEEIRLKETNMENLGPTLFVADLCRKNNHGRKTSKGRFGGIVECLNCGKKGHIKKYCREEGVNVVNVEDALLMIEIRKFRYVSKLSSNLISISQLDVEVYGISFGGESSKVTKRAHVVTKGKKSVQHGNNFGYGSSMAKLVTFKDVLRLVKKTLKLG